MNITKRKVKIISSIVLSAILVFLIHNFVYHHYFKQDITQFRYGFSAGSAISPNEQHSVHLVIKRAEMDSDVSYIVGWLNFAGNAHPYNNGWAESEPRIIFWQRVETDSINEKVFDDGLVIENWIDLEWMDNDTVYINGTNVNINRGFDYRRN